MTINYPDYPANWQPLANDAADSSFRGNPMSAFYEGGRVGTKAVAIRVPRAPAEYAKGGLAGQAQKVADAGVGGDELIIHINRNEFEQLRKEWGEPTINPHTGMPQFTPFYKQKWFAPVAALASAALMATGVGAPLGAALLPASLAGETIAGAALPSLVGNALIGAGTGAITGGSKGALTGAALGGLGTLAMGAMGSTSPGVTGTGSEGFSGWWNRMGSGDYFGAAGAADTARAPHPLDAPAQGNPAAVGATGPVVPPGTKLATESTGVLGKLMDSKMAIPAALLAASALGGGGGAAAMPTAAAGSTATDPNMGKRLETAPLTRTRMAMPDNYYTYGSTGENRFYKQQEEETPTVNAAMGGPLARYVQGGGTGRSDSIDAKLSDGEYVIDAETVALLGDGSSKAGAKRLDQFRANVRKQKGRELAKGKFSPDAKRPEEYI